MVEALWLVEALQLLGSDSLSRKYSLLVVGVAKVQSEQGRYQQETLGPLECPKDTIQVCRTHIASQQRIGLDGVGTVEQKPRLKQQMNQG